MTWTADVMYSPAMTYANSAVRDGTHIAGQAVILTKTLFLQTSGELMKTNSWLLSAALVLTLLIPGCANPPAKVGSASTRLSYSEGPFKRVVVVIRNLVVLDRRAVRSLLSDALKSNQVNALVFEHDPRQLASDPILANRDAVRALRPQAILQLTALQTKNSLHGNLEAIFRASLTIPGGRTIWEANVTMHGVEQGESALVNELMKKLNTDRIIDKNAIDSDEPPGSSRT
jgi:hypothetical protein